RTRHGTSARGYERTLASLLTVADELGRRFLVAERDAFACECELDVLTRFIDTPLHRRERDLERIGDLRVRESDDVAQEQRHRQVDVEPFDRTPHGVDRLETLHRRIDHLEGGYLLQSYDRARAPLGGPKLVEHAVLGDLEQPGRELRAKREARQALEDSQEDFLGQV